MADPARVVQTYVPRLGADMGARGSRWTGAWWAATPAAAQQALDDLTEAGLIEPLKVDSDAYAFKSTP